MEECTSENNNKKRARDDSGELEPTSPESKRVNAITDSDPNQPDSDRVGPEMKPDSPVSNECKHDSEDDSTESNETENEAPEMLNFREDILDILDGPEMVPEIEDLDSVIRSFEEEILQPSPSPTLDHLPAVELTSDSGEAQPDLGYLLEASDDELGLPPTVSASQGQTQPINASIGNDEADNWLRNIAGFDNELPSYDSFEFGLGDGVADGSNYGEDGNGDFVTMDGLFDHSEGSDFAWRTESLPAL